MNYIRRFLGLSSHINHNVAKILANNDMDIDGESDNDNNNNNIYNYNNEVIMGNIDDNGNNFDDNDDFEDYNESPFGYHYRNDYNDGNNNDDNDIDNENNNDVVYNNNNNNNNNKRARTDANQIKKQKKAMKFLHEQNVNKTHKSKGYLDTGTTAGRSSTSRNEVVSMRNALMKNGNVLFDPSVFIEAEPNRN
jgi:hypothetical protein